MITAADALVPAPQVVVDTQVADEIAFQREAARHIPIALLAHRLLKKWRKKLWIPQHWDIELFIFCPPKDPADDLDGVLGICDWGYRPNAHFVIRLRCNLDKDEMEWVLVHELLEALFSDYGEFCLPFYIESDDVQWRERMDRDHHRIRDAVIEHLLHAFFGRHSAVRFKDADQ